jgi:hypothetical protein
MRGWRPAKAMQRRILWVPRGDLQGKWGGQRTKLQS